MFNHISRMVAIVLFAGAVIVCAQNEGEVISEKANLRGTPNTAGKVVTEISQGSRFEVIKQTGAWFLIQTSDFVGWVHGNTIRLGTGASQYLSDFSGLSRSEPVTILRQTAPARTTTRSSSAARSSGYIRGPRGGCYYLNSRGNKVYVDRGLCS